MSDHSNSAKAAGLWVEENREVVEETYQSFARTGEWPTASELQRHFDRAGESISVQDVIDSKPRVLNEARPIYLQYLTLHLRHLMWVPRAGPLVTVCVRAVQRAVVSYLSDAETPFVSSEDPLTEPPSKLDGDLSNRVYKVLSNEYPSPFGGSGSSGDSWRMEVDSRFVRQFRDVTNIEDLVARQDVVRAEIAAQAGMMAPTFQVRSAFDVQEFVEPEPEQSLASVPDTTPKYPGAEVFDSRTLDDVRDNSEQEPILFISWSNGRSRSVAEKLVPLLVERLPGVDVFFSPTSIEPGADPSRRMFDEGLLGSSALLVVLTHKSASSAYVIWETASAWALRKLVIPLFVEIEPSDVPGPLVGKVQGVHLADQDDVDRAIRRIAAHFGVVTPTDLSNEEYDSLLSSEGQGESNPQSNLAGVRSQLLGYVARWQTLYDGLQGTFDTVDRSRLAAEIQQIVAEAVRFLAQDDPESALASELSTIAIRAGDVKRIRVLSDGGISFNALDGGCFELIERVRSVLHH